VAGRNKFAARLPACRERPPVSKPVMGWMLALTILAFISVLWALDPTTSWARAVKIAPQLITGGLLIGLMPRLAQRASRGWVWLLPALYGAGLCIVVFNLYGGLSLYRLTHDVARLNSDDLNRTILFFTLLYVPVMASVFALPFLNPKKKYAGMAALTLLLLLSLCATASQSAQLAFILIPLFYFLFPYRRRATWLVMGVCLIAGLLLTPFLAQIMFKTLPALIIQWPLLGSGYGFAANRMEIWDYISRYALQRPLQGFGIDAARAVPAFDNHQIYQRGLTIPHPHNFAVQLWMEFGVIGALFGAGLISYILLFLYRQPRPAQRIALPVLIACMTAAAMTYSLWQGWWLGLLFLAAALTRLAMEFLSPEPDVL
jgi:O-antigen ligase